MRTDAASFGARWRALLIGVDSPGDPRLAQLGSAERDANELARALAYPEGCAVPPAQILTLTGAAATKAAILGALGSICASATPNDSLLIYFAGHGLVYESDFYLCNAGTRCDDLATTTFGSSDLDVRLGELSVRGVLVVLDCCESAAFAENAPETFRSMREGEYRILLSAARADQRSWELGDGQGTLFSRILIDIISGQISVGKQPGAIYFADLMRELYDRIEELRETIAGSAPAQDPVYVGAFVKDPLLFVHRSLSLKQIALNTARYSPAYVHQRLRRVGVFVAMCLFFVATVYYAWLQNTQYAAADGEKITIYNGYPGLNGPGFPVALWTLGYGADSLAPAADGTVPLPLIAPLGKPVLPLAEAHLAPAIQAAHRLDAGDEAAARALSLQVLADPDAVFQSRLYGEIILAYTARAEDLPRLREMIQGERRDVRRYAVGALARLDPAFIFPSLSADLPEGENWPHADIVKDLEAPCTPHLAAYLSEVMGVDSNVPYPSQVLDTALRLNCALTLPALLKAVRRATIGENEQIAGYARHLHLEAALRPELGRIVSGSADNEFTRSGAIDTYMLLAGATCLPDLKEYLQSEFDFAKLSAALAMGRLCPGHDFEITWHEESRSLSLELTHEGKSLWSLGFTPGEGGKELFFKPVLEEILRSGRRDLEGALVTLAATSGDSQTRELALIALQELGSKVRPDAAYLDSNALGVRRAAYELERRVDPAGMMKSLLGRIGKEDMFYVEMLGRLALPEDAFRRLEAMLEGDANQRRDAACVLAMQGSITFVTDLAVRPEADIRKQAADCLSFNENAPEILQRIEAREDLSFPIETVFELRRAVAKKRKLAEELAGLATPAEQLWRLSLIDDDPGPGLNSGLRYWIRERRYELRLKNRG